MYVSYLRPNEEYEIVADAIFKLLQSNNHTTSINKTLNAESETSKRSICC